MQDLIGMITTLRRPRLLNEAAQYGARRYCRGAMLARLLGVQDPPRHGVAILRLLELEDEANTLRRENAPDYAARHHLDLMIALLGEARLMAAGPSTV